MQRIFSAVGLTLSLLMVVFVLGCGQSGDTQQAAKQEAEQSADPHAGMMGHGDMGGGVQLVDGKLPIGPWMATLPEGWTAERPASSMRQAQIHLAPVEGDPDEASVVAFYFGPEAGSVEMNIERWMNQFSKADGSPLTEADVTRSSGPLNDHELTFISFNGTQKPSSMPGAPQTGEQSGWMNVSAIIMTDQGPWFFKGTGPEATMQHNIAAFKQFLNNLEYGEMTAHHG
ncbi:hypothetical protein KQI52_15630 [bacterium]|nr:hypothetical protein [bacterium]